MLRRPLRAAAAIAVGAILAGCAAEVPVMPATLARLDRSVPDITIASPVRVELPTGRARPLPQGGLWRAVGTLPQGTVYRPVESVFTIVGRNVHEAYLVVQGSTLHGFYLPGEVHYSPLAAPLFLPLAKGANP